MATQITTVAGFTSGDDTITTDLLQDFSIDGLAGDDNITLEEAASNLTLKGAGGDDLITADSNISATSLLKGGASDDTFQFAGAVAGSSIYGGKGADSIYFARTLTGGVVTGDTGADRFTFVGKVSGGALISGGDGDDSFVLNERITDSTIKGGESRDSVDLNENSSGSAVKTGADNDIVRVTGKHSDLVVKGGSGDDSFDIEGSFTGSGNKFYGGKGEDSIELNTTASVAVYGDKDDDIFLFTNAAAVAGASIFGGDGADTVDMTALIAGSTTVVKGGKGNDSILASDITNSDTIAATIFGGQGNDTIIQDQSGTQNGYYYGDKGDDVIDHSSNESGILSGGEGNDSIVVDTLSTDTNLAHTVIGGAGVDTLDVIGLQTGDLTTTAKYAPTAETTILKYSSFAELFTSGDFVDDINIAAVDTAVVAEVAEAVTFTDSDEFVRATNAGGVRDATREGLIIRTSSTVTAGSTVTLSATAADNLFGLDFSAGTTGNTSIDASAETGALMGMLLKGGSGRNTIKGTGGKDYIEGGKNDVLIGGAEIDIIVANDGKDSIEGGSGNDSIMLGSNLTFQDTVKGGDGTGDILSYKPASSTVTNDLDNVTEIESIKIEDVNAEIVTKESLVATDKTLAVSFTTSTTTKTLDFNGAAEDGNGEYSVTGGSGADTIIGGDGDDTITGLLGIDVIDLDAGTSVVVTSATAAAADRDVVTNFTLGTDVLGLTAAKTTVGTAAGNTAVVEAEATAAAQGNGNAYNLEGAIASTNAVDLVVFATAAAPNMANADLSAATDGTELLKALVNAGVGNTADGITLRADGDQIYAIIDDDTNSYLYYITSSGDAEAVASEISLVATFTGLSDVSTLAAAQTLMF